MSTQTVTKKRKSTGDAVPATKKVKTAKSASKPAPLKSALKKPVSKDDAAAKPTKTAKAKLAISPEPSTKAAVELAEAAAAAPTPKDEVAAKKTKSSKPRGKPVKKAKAKKDAEIVENEPSAVDNVASGVTALTEDQTAALIAGFSSSEDEASDAEEEKDAVAISKLPAVQAGLMGDIKKRIAAASSSNPERTPGVIYVGRIPHGFYEPQMRAYFSQFGTIANMRLARNRKTGKSQHYAFLEFASGAVAEIVAKTMDKYLLFGHIMQVRTVPREQVKENMWDGGGRRKKPAPRNRLEGGRLKRGMVREDWDKRTEREQKRREAKMEVLREMGYEFEMPALRSAGDVPARPKEIDVGGNDEGVEKDDVVDEEKVLAIEPSGEEPKTIVSRTVQSEPNGVKVTEVKTTTKKRTAGEAKTKKTKKAKV